MQPAIDIDEQTAHYNQVLRDLVDMATDIARIVHTEAKFHAARRHETETAALPPTPKRTPTPTPTTPASSGTANGQAPDPTLAFDRIARTIRRTILVAQQLVRPKTAHTEDLALRRIATRKRILRNVEDVIQRNVKQENRGALQGELRERLDSPDLEDDIDHRPLPDIVLDICRDLQVAMPYAGNYKRRTPAQVAALRAQAAAIPATWQPAPRLALTNPAPASEAHASEAPRRRPAKRPDLQSASYEEARNRQGIG